MMKLCGHTMGTPGYDVFESANLFAELGLQGMEIRCAVDGHLSLEAVGEADARAVADHARGKGIDIACLTPYYKDFGTDESTIQTLAGLETAVRAASWMDCGLVRALAGIWPVERRERGDILARTVDGLRWAGDVAAEHGVCLAVENHIGTLAMSAEETAEFIERVNHPAVGVLLDYYWNAVAGDKSPREVISLLGGSILHCHVKNLVWVNGKHTTVLLEDGIIDWAEVLRELHRSGFQGYLSDEYEKYWKPEFPGPEVGMRANAAYLRRCAEKAKVPMSQEV